MTDLQFETLKIIHNAVSISLGIVETDRLHTHMQSIVSMWLHDGYITQTYADESYFNSFTKSISVFEISDQAKIDYTEELRRRCGVVTT